MPYMLKLPQHPQQQQQQLSPTGSPRRYPLLVYLHGGGNTAIVKGDRSSLFRRQVEFLASPEENPLVKLADDVKSVDNSGAASDFIFLAPCCPGNVSQLNEWRSKESNKQKLFWFLSCSEVDYNRWKFDSAERSVEVELLVVELLLNVCRALPVDPERIYFMGSSSGGYGALRLAELLPHLPAAVIPSSGYYPEVRGQDHDWSTLAERFKAAQCLRVWPLHCKGDPYCPEEDPAVGHLHRVLREHLGVLVTWIPSDAKRNIHFPLQCMVNNPDHFFEHWLSCKRQPSRDLAKYLVDQFEELIATARKRGVKAESIYEYI